MYIISSFFSYRKIALLVVLMISYFLFMTNTAFSAIKHLNINVTLEAVEENELKIYDLDLNSDGIDDFSFHHNIQGGDFVCEIYSGWNHNENEVLTVDDRVPVMLNYGDNISENLSIWTNGYNGMGSSAMYFEADWLGAENKFAALRFKINGQFHYGWVRVLIPSNSSHLQIIDCAYEETALANISAGDGATDVQDEYSQFNPEVFSCGKNVTIRFTSDFNDNTSLKIFDLNGSLVKDMKLKNQNSYVNLEELRSGIYFLYIDSGSLIVRKKLSLFDFN